MGESLTVDELCKKFDEDLKTPLSAETYKSVIYDLFEEVKNGKITAAGDNIRTIIDRATKDHSDTKEYLAELVQKDPAVTFELFKYINNSAMLVRLFDEVEEAEPYLALLESRISTQPNAAFKFTVQSLTALYREFGFDMINVKAVLRPLILRILDTESVFDIAMLLALFLDIYEKEFEDEYCTVMEDLINEAEKGSDEDILTSVVCSLNYTYITMTAACTFVLMTKKVNNLIMARISKGDDDEFVHRVLAMLSAACIDETVRVFIAENYLSMLEKALQIDKFQLESALVLIKTWSFTKLTNVNIQKLADILLTCFLKNSEEKNKQLDVAIEGLAYLSLKTSVKLLLRHTPRFIDVVGKVIETPFSYENIYGVLIMLANITCPPSDDNEINKSIRNISDINDMRNPGLSNDINETIIEDPTAVIKFNKESLLDNELLSCFTHFYENYTPGSAKQLMRIIYNLTRTKSHIPKCVEQGSIPSILEFVHTYRADGKFGHKIDLDMSYMRLLAIRSLTQMLIYTDPNVIFHKNSPLDAISCLFELLPVVNTSDLGEDNNIFMKANEHIKPVDKVEALWSLTNLATMNGSIGEEICKTIATNDDYWECIENLLLDDTMIIQRSALELLCNLVSYPIHVASKIFNFENPQSLHNFNTLVKLILLTDVKSQRAVVAVFANSANAIPFIAGELLKKDELIKNCMNTFANQMDDAPLRQRFIMLFYALFENAPSQGEEAMKNFQRILEFRECEKFTKALQVAITRTDTDPEFGDVIPAIQAKFQKKD
ncbi:similar to Saccharomyces cerevisiae YOR035C SHE4 Protein containing a UCS (UNC-45/CRO1/SHE4) domain, binds to myosin motor domains to regulate myosin function [Maudiozyma barnettii]|uniref:Similar to Saccharomyces cerevisiae YOR035C SHE4 Protein containing a UCS (UNC-45/CRO1/SHE4) domain, binds to myosin motor domains to regulate myosin function n=1 Tax=Maudiozyma barnettii TaxID=61262 RepID=A0A8H2ZIV7_9SACH|nr:She4p [Kazachstania barnettii]CAB4256298.1 similar to Saccharomyces cerevisiae YOR035C SHE4 Protein containing a UCS (UNC-45/CRO1/SHE4) domain, binds to myosin motor domains to regulate myosin function [Kazachstania barnettii]CAD1784907.1 similar to Saccharomyces cerevisiae YOR035C SHE4 Protein containing a UCS (UNC-45/CRO1/SHE4) domain, binds to myosin motor domains to regulate myosin function [Kazachstania barnettii]